MKLKLKLWLWQRRVEVRSWRTFEWCVILMLMAILASVWFIGGRIHDWFAFTLSHLH